VRDRQNDVGFPTPGVGARASARSVAGQCPLLKVQGFAYRCLQRRLIPGSRSNSGDGLKRQSLLG
jgi:hypothetical protein